MQLWLSMAQQGRTRAFFGADESLFPMKVLAKIDDAPFMLIMHCSDDTAVAVQGSYDFEEAARKVRSWESGAGCSASRAWL